MKTLLQALVGLLVALFGTVVSATLLLVVNVLRYIGILIALGLAYTLVRLVAFHALPPLN